MGSDNFYKEFEFTYWLITNTVKSKKGDIYRYRPHNYYPYNLNQLIRIYDQKQRSYSNNS